MGPDKCLDRFFIADINVNDLVIIITPGFDWAFKEEFPNSYRGGLSEAYLRCENPTSHFLDNARHCDGEINKRVAEIIWEDLNEILNRKPFLQEKNFCGEDYFISPDVLRYFESYFKIYFSDISLKNSVGAIVMNCNPFTNGHRYLIEYAASKVEQLIIFVVQEDKSYFKFEDRFKMVNEGVKGLENVIVVPSGEYIISKETFAQYFDKESAIEVKDMDYDVYIFGKIVAKHLGIQVRFLGEEPNDKVTAAYNERIVDILSVNAP